MEFTNGTVTSCPSSPNGESFNVHLYIVDHHWSPSESDLTFSTLFFGDWIPPSVHAAYRSDAYFWTLGVRIFRSSILLLTEEVFRMTSTNGTLVLIERYVSQHQKKCAVVTVTFSLIKMESPYILGGVVIARVRFLEIHCLRSFISFFIWNFYCIEW